MNQPPVQRPPFIVRYLSRPFFAAWTIAFVALLVGALGLVLTGHGEAAAKVNLLGVPIIAGGFGCWRIWLWAIRPR